MGCWGPGLLQSDDDHAIARDLDDMLGVPLSSLLSSRFFSPSSPSLAHQLDAPAHPSSPTTLLNSKLDKILSGNAGALSYFAPYHPRERIIVILALLGMCAGAKIEGRHRDSLRVLRPALSTVEQQVQLLAALDGYKEGTPWVLPLGCGKEDERDKLGIGRDGFWFGGLGHSADEEAPSDIGSTSCFGCAKDEVNLRRCSRCRIAQYCSTACHRMNWSIHKRVCNPPPVAGAPSESWDNKTNEKDNSDVSTS
ncbi:hypothetical protein F4810DRAFT_283473 [Camillea tinctor]|nr:hypothetical protein F4810DRAFT_283473 [Camillea tinctor]